MRRMVAAVPCAVGAVLIAGACARSGSQPSAARERCALRTSDSVFARGGPVYRDCAVDRAARPTTTANLNPPLDRPSPGCYRVQVEFVVATDGRPELETVRTVYATTPAFERAVIESMAQWRYDPARIGGSPVRQIVTAERKMGVVVTVVPSGSGPPQPPRNPC